MYAIPPATVAPQKLPIFFIILCFSMFAACRVQR